MFWQVYPSRRPFPDVEKVQDYGYTPPGTVRDLFYWEEGVNTKLFEGEGIKVDILVDTDRSWDVVNHGTIRD